MGIVRNLVVRAGADFSELTNGMRRVQNSLNDFNRNINSTLKGIGAAMAAIGAAVTIKEAVKSAMDTEAALQQVNRQMGASANEFTKWANENAAAFGMAKSEAIKYGAVYSNLISGFSNGTEQTFQRTQQLLKASAVVASGTGRTMDDVMERIRSGLLGNTEAIEDLGINVNIAMIESTNAFKQFANGQHWNQLDFQTQQQIRLMAILEQANTKYGDSLNQNTATSMAMFVAQLKNIQLALGQAFLPILNVVLPVLTAFAAKVASVLTVVAQFMQALFGKRTAVKQQVAQAKATNQQASAVTGLGNALKKTGKEAQKAAKASRGIAGFDEINSLADPSSSSGSKGASASGTGGGVPTGAGVDMPDTSPVENGITQISEKIQAFADKIRGFFGGIRDFFKGVGNFVTAHKDIIIAALSGLAAAFGTFLVIANLPKIIGAFETLYLKILYFIDGIKKVFITAFGFLASPLGLVLVAIAGLTAAFVYFYRTNEKFKGFVDGILNQIKDAAVYLWKNILVPFGEFLGKVFAAAWDIVKVAAQFLWKNVFVPLGDFMVWMWKNVVSPLASVLKDILGVAFNFVSDVAKSLWKNVLVPLGDFFKATFSPTIEAVSAVFKFLWNNVLVPFSSFLGTSLKPVFSDLTTVIQFLWNNVLKPLVTFLTGVFKQTFDTVFQGIGGIIKGLQTSFIGLMNFITGVFTGNWKKAWEGVKDIFQGVFESLYSIVKTPLNLIIDAINLLISGLNSISIDIPKWVPKYGGQTFGVNISKIPHLAKGGITNGPMMAVIGDNPGGKEVVSPLGELKDMIASSVGTAFMSAMQFSNNNSNNKGDVIIQLDGKTLARVLNPYLLKEENRIGNSIITTT
ncbi:phage tail protein [Heyndrickxia shackletonii]|uniref:phage tail protein n=1 Tax=Heyndrickxia shackletonii TaxID=157838 RepID=UPI0009FA95AF|nr:hypothetical protein [Heyndrickxia shackletonii]NEY99239.1 hypothetical protein [Heyndrickxia shackletonii]